MLCHILITNKCIVYEWFSPTCIKIQVEFLRKHWNEKKTTEMFHCATEGYYIIDVDHHHYQGVPQPGGPPREAPDQKPLTSLLPRKRGDAGGPQMHADAATGPSGCGVTPWCVPSHIIIYTECFSQAYPSSLSSLSLVTVKVLTVCRLSHRHSWERDIEQERERENIMSTLVINPTYLNRVRPFLVIHCWISLDS